MSFGAGFGEQTATVYRGAGKTKTNLGTMSVHVQPLSAAAIRSGGGLYPIGSLHAFFYGTPSIDVKHGDWMEIDSIRYEVLNIEPHTQAKIIYYDYILDGYTGAT